VQDTCESCDSYSPKRIDLSSGAWGALESNFGLGLLTVTYSSCGSNSLEDSTAQGSPDNSLSWGVWIGIGVGVGVISTLIVVAIVFLVVRAHRAKSEQV